MLVNRTLALTLFGGMALALGACSGAGSFFQEAADNAGEVGTDTKQKLGDAIDAYCVNVPQTARLTLRGQVNQFADKGEVQVTCEGDDA